MSARYFLMGLWGVALTCGATAFGQTDPPKQDPMSETTEALDAGRPPASATLERIMEQAVRNIAVRYNLNDAQREMTDNLMKREVRRFLREYENEVWPIIGELLRTRLGLNTPEDPEVMKRIGESAKPLIKAAEEYVVRANEKWREILTPEQKKVHDYDLADMQRQFQAIEQNFHAWETGTPVEGGLFPRADLKNQPPRPARPPEVQPEVSTFNPNRFLETLVEQFIKDYHLVEGQITAARSILEEFKNKANDYKTAKKDEFAAAAAAHEDAMQRRDLSAVKKANREQKKLLKPVFALCDQMEDRLEKLLTTAQIERHQGRRKADAASTRSPRSSQDDRTKKPVEPEDARSASDEEDG